MKRNYLRVFKSSVMVLLTWLSFTTFAQDRKVTGKVSDAAGSGIPGVSILVKGTSTGTSTDVDGNFALSVKGSNAVLTFSSVGYESQEVRLGNQSVINVSLADNSAVLNEIVVTGYQQIRKRDITGAVTVVNADELKTVKSSSFIQNLAGRAPGVTVSTSGSPGDATNIRIRGISSFTSNDPLYIIDGVPVLDKYQNTINPEDIESIQILKDASTASIYGSRASNGVIVISTKQGKAGKVKVSYNGSFGLANPVKGYDEILNQSSEYYAAAIRSKFQADPTNIPAYAKTPGSLTKYINPFANTVDLNSYDPLNNIITETNQVGTNWWDATTRTAQVNDHSLNISGGNEVSVFNVSASFLAQQGVFNYTHFNRGTLRANSTHKIGKKMRIGENLMYSANWGVGIGSMSGNNNEQGVIGDIIKSTPVVSQYDIKGGPGGHISAQTGNFTNPDWRLYNNKDNTNTYRRMLGNVFTDFEIIKGLTARTNFGLDLGNGWNRSFNQLTQPFRSEGPKSGNSFSENWSQSINWTWTNTLNYNKTFGKHAVTGLVGQEAIAGKGRSAGGGLANYFTEDINAWYLNTALADPGSRSVYSNGGEDRLASYFAKADYSFNDKYLISGTIRRDGSSKFLSDVRYGIFPAVSLGWRLSQESFMKDLTWLTDLKVRASYGELGNQQIRSYNFASIYGGSIGSTFYDINGTNSSTVTGYSLRSRGNESTKWETSKTKNIGIDASVLNNSINFVLDVYSRNTDNLLFNPSLPGTAGGAAAPFVNVGSMQNNGFDFSTNYRKNVNKDLNLNFGLNLSHYKNEVKKVALNTDFFYSDGAGLNGRLPNASISVINKVGYPISSFNGYVVDGLIKTEAERAMHTGTGATIIGGLKFKDVNGDGVINDSDITIIGNPHPKLTGGFNMGANYKNFDLNAFLTGSYGNDIFTGYWIQSYFMNFNSNVLNNVLENQGTGTWPKLDQLDASSRNSSSFYIQDGSYLRLTNLQLGYTLPNTMTKKAGISKARIYLQGQNLFTLTNYFGTDPAISSANIGNSGQVNDGGMGIDNGNYPSNRVTNLGINLEF